MVRYGRGVQVLIKTGVSCRVKRWTRATYTMASGIELRKHRFHLAINSNQAGREVKSLQRIDSRALG
jgi:hypothetical protein